ncbi:MAG: trypsin-like serine protease [Azospirillum sp.]|nr:trypsin-like serine protease [Azospirillum sp.]
MAELFVMPQVTRDSSGRNIYTWGDAALPGVRTIKQCPPDIRSRVEATLRDRLAQLAPHLNDPIDGPLFRSALYLAGQESLQESNGEARLAAWGMLPTDASGSEALRTAHFQDTLGPYWPFPVPLIDEAQHRPALATQTDLPVLPVVPLAPEPRPWLAPAVVVAVLGILAATLLIPGVLRFGYGPVSSASLRDPQTLRSYNESLRQQIEEAERLLATPDALCPAPQGGARLPQGGTTLPQGGASPPPGGTGVVPGGGGVPQGSGANPAASGLDATVPPNPSAIPLAPQHPGQTGEGASATLADLLEKATVLVLTPDGVGSGFFVAPDTILTNSHVVGSHDRVAVINKTLGRLVAGAVKSRTSVGAEPGGTDFALVALTEPASGQAVLPFAASVKRLQSVAASGYPFIVLENDDHFRRLREGDRSAIPEVAATQGAVMVVQNQDSGKPVILHQAMTSPGNSGGPLVDLCGRAVGINTYVRFGGAEETGARVNVALGVPAIVGFLGQTGLAVEPVQEACLVGQPSERASTPSAAPHAAGVPPAQPPATPGQPAPSSAPPSPAPSPAPPSPAAPPPAAPPPADAGTPPGAAPPQGSSAPLESKPGSADADRPTPSGAATDSPAGPAR